MMGFYISNILKARLMLYVGVVEEINPENGSQQKLKTTGVYLLKKVKDSDSHLAILLMQKKSEKERILS